MARKRYIVKYDTQYHKKGEIVYKNAFHDYGLASEDSRLTGVEHMSVSRKENGDYPYSTIPTSALQEDDGVVQDNNMKVFVWDYGVFGIEGILEYTLDAAKTLASHPRYDGQEPTSVHDVASGLVIINSGDI